MSDYYYKIYKKLLVRKDSTLFYKPGKPPLPFYEFTRGMAYNHGMVDEQDTKVLDV